ncbi:unnamed protein product, partial [marine sediment metagenome]
DEMVRTLVPVWQRTKAPFAKKLLYTGCARMGRMTEAAKYK